MPPVDRLGRVVTLCVVTDVVRGDIVVPVDVSASRVTRLLRDTAQSPAAEMLSAVHCDHTESSTGD